MPWNYILSNSFQIFDHTHASIKNNFSFSGGELLWFSALTPIKFTRNVVPQGPNTDIRCTDPR